eukprot:jgi/Mesen1/9009/ME000563S08329
MIGGKMILKIDSFENDNDIPWKCLKQKQRITKETREEGEGEEDGEEGEERGGRMRLEDVQSACKKQRIAAHTHIKGLGLKDDGIAVNMGAGACGGHDPRQAQAGRARCCWRAYSAPARRRSRSALRRSSAPRCPSAPMVGSEVYSAEVKKRWRTFGAPSGFASRRKKEVYEGEVTDGADAEGERERERRSISHVIIGLKTVKGTKQLKLDPSICDSLLKEKVAVGGVIYVEANSKAVKRVGRSDAYATRFNLEAEEYVPLPKGEIHKKKEIVHARMPPAGPRVLVWPSAGRGNRRGDLSPHGIPVDLLDRLVIIRTLPYTPSETISVKDPALPPSSFFLPFLAPPASFRFPSADRAALWSKAPGGLDESDAGFASGGNAILSHVRVRATRRATQVATRTLLRHAVQLLAPAFVIALSNGRDQISKEF